VLPALQTNSDGLKQVLEELVKQYKSKQDEMDKWKVGIVPQDPSPQLNQGTAKEQHSSCSKLGLHSIGW
jgi:hypothetical protein